MTTTTGRRATIVAFAGAGIGAIAFASGLGQADRTATFAALIASWLFFAGITAGALASRALFELIGARWARGLAPISATAMGFAPTALLLLAVITCGARLAPWLHADPSSTWTSTPALAIRELVLTGGLFACGYALNRASGALAAIYCIAFGVVLSFWGFDLVLGADDVWESTLVGPLVFVGAFIAGVDFVLLLALRRKVLPDDARRDAAKLVLALSIFWAYLFWSQYLTIWYGNLPDEVGYALRRLDGGWGAIVLIAIACAFAVPFVALLHPAGRRSKRAFGVLLGVQLFGLWLVCELLIVPSLTPSSASALDIRNLLVAIGLASSFALSIARQVHRLPTSSERTSS